MDSLKSGLKSAGKLGVKGAKSGYNFGKKHTDKSRGKSGGADHDYDSSRNHKDSYGSSYDNKDHSKDGSSSSYGRPTSLYGANNSGSYASSSYGQPSNQPYANPSYGQQGNQTYGNQAYANTQSGYGQALSNQNGYSQNGYGQASSNQNGYSQNGYGQASYNSQQYVNSTQQTTNQGYQTDTAPQYSAGYGATTGYGNTVGNNNITPNQYSPAPINNLNSPGAIPPAQTPYTGNQLASQQQIPAYISQPTLDISSLPPPPVHNSRGKSTATTQEAVSTEPTTNGPDDTVATEAKRTKESVKTGQTNEDRGDNSRYDPRDDVRDDARDNPRDNRRIEPRDEPRVESRDEPRVEPRVEPRDDPRDYPRDDLRDDPRSYPGSYPRYESRGHPGNNRRVSYNDDRRDDRYSDSYDYRYADRNDKLRDDERDTYDHDKNIPSSVRRGYSQRGGRRRDHGDRRDEYSDKRTSYYSDDRDPDFESDVDLPRGDDVHDRRGYSDPRRGERYENGRFRSPDNYRSTDNRRGDRDEPFQQDFRVDSRATSADKSHLSVGNKRSLKPQEECEDIPPPLPVRSRSTSAATQVGDAGRKDTASTPHIQHHLDLEKSVDPTIASPILQQAQSLSPSITSPRGQPAITSPDQLKRQLSSAGTRSSTISPPPVRSRGHSLVAESKSSLSPTTEQNVENVTNELAHIKLRHTSTNGADSPKPASSSVIGDTDFKKALETKKKVPPKVPTKSVSLKRASPPPVVPAKNNSLKKTTLPPVPVKNDLLKKKIPPPVVPRKKQILRNAASVENNETTNNTNNDLSSTYGENDDNLSPIERYKKNLASANNDR